MLLSVTNANVDMALPVLQETETCWRMAHADRASFLVDGSDYFASAKNAMEQAQHSIYLIGWEFNLEIDLNPDSPDGDFPDQLREFLVHLVTARPHLQIRILQWDGAMVFNIAKQLVPFIKLQKKSKSRIHFRLDSEHPTGGCHHQKIVVVDDSIAFCGGIDMTTGRWDTQSHLPDDPRRTSKDGSIAGPWHDVTMAVDGAAARALGDLARERWSSATGERLSPPPGQRDIWPDALGVSCRNTDVGIARTKPRFGKSSGVNEVEKFWLAAVKCARSLIYIENQFLASVSVCDALAERLSDPDGPDVVIVLPCSAETWVEQEVMDSARAYFVSKMRAADTHNRLAIYYPVNSKGEEIYVHAKILVVDDRLIRIGSSNLSNRSMRVDSECDLVIEAQGRDDIEKAILQFRDGLIAEHLGIPQEAIEQKLAESDGYPAKSIEALRKGSSGPTLLPLEAPELTAAEKALVESKLFNSDEKLPLPERLNHFCRRTLNRYHHEVQLAAGLTVAAAAAVGASFLISSSRRK